jgi:ParB family transcriptional regulator, chromosome partitioning protein
MKRAFPDPTALPHDSILDVLKEPRARTELPSIGRPQTFVGRVGAAQNDGLQAKIDELEKERSGGMLLLKLDPTTIGRTAFANRLGRSLSTDDDDFKRLKASIRAHGQDTPIRVRPAATGARTAYELVEGHRRHAAILELAREVEGGFQILARLDAKAADSKDLVLKMYRENAERADLSAFETGHMFRSWLDAKLFDSQVVLAKASGASEQTVSRCLTIAALPEPVIQAFGDPRVIPQRWAEKLAGLLKHHSDKVLKTAREIAKKRPRLEPDAVLDQLTESVGSVPRKHGSETREESFKVKGKIVWTFAHRRGFVAAKFPKSIDPDIEAEIAVEVKKAVDKVITRRLGHKK